MRANEIKHGSMTRINLRLSGCLGAAANLVIDDEVFLFSDDYGIILSQGEHVWDAEGATVRQQTQLQEVMRRGSPRVAWVVAVKATETTDTIMAVIEVREFSSRIIWDDAVEVGVDERIVDGIRTKLRSVTRVDDILKWLRSELVITGSAEGWDRVILSGSPVEELVSLSGCRLHGMNIAIDAACDHMGRLTVVRVVWDQKRGNEDSYQQLRLVEGCFDFVDHTIAGSLGDTIRTQLDQLVMGADSYLGLWNDYNEMERGYILANAREFGYHPYFEVRRLPQGSWRFQLAQGAQVDRKALTRGGEYLQATEHPPSEITGASTGVAKTQDSLAFIGECVGFDATQKTIDVMPSPSSAGRLPDKGYLSLSLVRDNVRLDRRKRAQELIANGEAGMPQLGLLLEGAPVPIARRKREKPLSATARAAFGGEPTGRQVVALKVALNTPDIALIQGPPGTGKTRVVAALMARLTEIAEEKDGLAGRYLLASYQHSAVEHAASVTKVLGLPAVKIGGKQGEYQGPDSVEDWRSDCIEAVRAELATMPERPVDRAWRDCQDLAFGYLMAPSSSTNVVVLLDKVQAIAREHIPAALADQLLELRQELEWKRVGWDSDADERELVLRAVRGLRVDSPSYTDDGQAQAYRALCRCEAWGLLTDDQEHLLMRAVQSDYDNADTFFEQMLALQHALIDRLLPDERPITAPTINVDVEALLGAVVDALYERMRVTAAGVTSVLHEYCEDLEKDRVGVRQAVMHYTAVLAATCQQADGGEMRQVKEEDFGKNVFETVVVDEAARANPLDLFIPMSLANRRIILVGDHRQLPHILEYEIERQLDRSQNVLTQEMLGRSLFERLFTLLKEREKADGIRRTVTLDVQYRMHPVLGAFVSEVFYKPYGEQFGSGRDASEFEHGLSDYGNAVAAWVDVPRSYGYETGTRSKRRAAEAEWVAEAAKRILVERPDLSVGVITFYAGQVDEIQRHMAQIDLLEPNDEGVLEVAEPWQRTRDWGGGRKERLCVGTVDAVQGKEFDVVLLSMTRCNNIRATDDSGVIAP